MITHSLNISRSFFKNINPLYTQYYYRTYYVSPRRYQVYDSILDTIGRTPIVKIHHLLSNDAQKKNIQLYAKLEYFNPLGSIKDRLAYAMITGAEKKGDLRPGMTVLEATSGNTGIGLAMVCATKGYPFVAVMAEQYSLDRRKIMRALGAKVILTPAAASGTGMINKAKELEKAHGWYWPRQFENPYNAVYHANTTGPEILIDFADKQLDYWITGYGTGGTFTGVGQILKCARPGIQIILAEPADAALIKSGIKQERYLDQSPSKEHESFHPHMIQGWTPNFIPAVCQEGLDANVVDTLLTVTNDDAIKIAKLLAQKEGIYSGISGGATTAVGIVIAENHAPPNSHILVMIPDTQERYLSTILYSDILEDMNIDEQTISLSTPSYHLKS